MSLDREASTKLDRELRAALARRDPGDPRPLHVIVTLAAGPPAAGPPPRTRDERMAWARDRADEFELEAAALVEALASHGAREVQLHWVARSLSGRLPLAAIELAARRPEVLRVALVVARDVLLAEGNEEPDA